MFSTPERYRSDVPIVYVCNVHAKQIKLFSFHEHLNFLMDYYESDKRTVVIGYQHMHVNDGLKREPDKQFICRFR